MKKFFSILSMFAGVLIIGLAIVSFITGEVYNQIFILLLLVELWAVVISKRVKGNPS